MNKLQLNEQTFAGFKEDGSVVVAQETWDKQSFIDVTLSKEDILKLAEAIKAEEEKVTTEVNEYKVYIWSGAKNDYMAASFIQKNGVNVVDVLKKCERDNKTTGMEWDTSRYIVKKRTVGYTDWVETKEY